MLQTIKFFYSDQRFRVAFYSTITVAINFFFTVVIVGKYGFGSISDLFFLCSSFLLMMSMIFSWSFSSLIIPQCIEDKDREGFIYGFFVVASMLALVLSPLISSGITFFIDRTYSSEYNKGVKIISLAISLSFAFDIINAYYVQHARLNERFTLVAILSLFSAIVTLIAIAAFCYMGLYWAYVISAALVFPKLTSLALYISFFQPGVKPTINLRFIFYFFKEGLMLLMVSAITRTGDLFEKIIAASIQPGFLSYFAFFQRFATASSTVLVNAVSSPTLNVFSNSRFEGDDLRPVKTMKVNFAIFFLVSTFLFLVLYFFHDYIVKLFGYNSNIDFSTFLVIFSISLTMLCRCMSQTLHNYCLAWNQQSLVSKYDLLVFVIAISSKVFLSWEFGAAGFLTAVVFESFTLLLFRYVSVMKVRSQGEC